MLTDKSQIRLPRSAYRSIRYRSNRSSRSNLKTASIKPSSLPKQFRIKKSSLLDNSINKTIQLSTLDADKSTYLNTFNSMMSCKHPLNVQEKLQWSKKAPKVYISNYQQLTDTQFTLLDVMSKPLTYLTETIDKSNNLLQESCNDLKLMKNNLERIKLQINNKIDKIQQQTIERINQFKSILRKDTIKHQQIKLKNINQITKLKILSKNQNYQLEQSYNKIIILQTQIFNSHPLELNNQIQMFYQKSNII